jgi:hypothetical protein
MPRRKLKRTARLAGPRPCAIQRILDLFLARLDPPILSGSHQKVGLGGSACQEKREHIRPSISEVDPGASRIRNPNGVDLAHPDIGFALFSLSPLIPLFSFGGWSAHKRFLGHAPKDVSCLRAHCQHGLHAQSHVLAHCRFAPHH